MSHNAYVRGSLANWATGSQVSAQNFWDLDQYCYGAINGDTGGTWSPSSVITIGGVNGLTLASGTPLTVGGNADFTGGFSCVNAQIAGATLSGAVTASGAVTISSLGSFTVAGLSTANIACSTTIGSAGKTCTIVGTLGASGNCTFGSTPGTTGTATTFAGDLVSAGSGGRVALSLLDIGDSDTTTGYHHRFIYTSLSTNRTLNLTIADPRVGTEFHVHNKASTYYVSVYIGGVLSATVTAGTNVMVIRGDSNWYTVTY
jgi:hypothetical protein